MPTLEALMTAHLQRRPRLMRAVFGVLQRTRPNFRTGETILVTRAEDVREVFARGEDFEIGFLNSAKMKVGPFLLGMDPGTHLYDTEKPVLRARLQQELAGFERAARQAAQRCAPAFIDRARGGPADVLGEYAERVTTRAAVQFFLGDAPPEARSRVFAAEPGDDTVRHWLRKLGTVIASSRPAPFGLAAIADAVADEFRSYLECCVRQARQQGADGVGGSNGTDGADGAGSSGDTGGANGTGGGLLGMLLRANGAGTGANTNANPGAHNAGAGGSDVSASAADANPGADANANANTGAHNAGAGANPGAHKSGASADSDARIVANLAGLMLAGSTAIGLSFCHALRQLVKRPRALAEAARTARDAGAGPELRAYWLEALRFHPTFPILPRFAPRQTVIAAGTARECIVPAGATLLTLPVTALFDPEEIAHPFEFMPGRELPGGTLLFGAGTHHCLGEALASSELDHLFAELLAAPGSEHLKTGRLRYDGGAVDFMKITLPEAAS